MDEILDNTPIPSRVKIYRRKWIMVGTFLGGPLATGYYFSQNFKAMNQPEKVQSTWLFAIITTIVVFGSAIFIPIIEHLPDMVLTIMYTGMAYVCYNRFQERQIDELVADETAVYGWGNTLSVAVISLVITILLALVFVLVYNEYEEMNTVAKTFGEAEHTIEYNRNNLTESEVVDVGQAFIEAEYFVGPDQNFLFLEKDKSTFIIYIAVFQDLSYNSDDYLYYKILRETVDDLLPDQKIIFKLVLDYRDEVKFTLE